MSNRLKFLKELDFKLDKRLIEKERNACRLISKLDGSTYLSSFYNLYLEIIRLIEIVNNNKIENINTTYWSLIRSISSQKYKSYEDKTIGLNIKALTKGKEFINKNNFINKQLLIDIQQTIRDTNDSIRNIPVVIKDGKYKTIYTPPNGYELILDYLDELEHFINNSKEFNNIDLLNSISPLIKSPIIHYQFESIHPFSDGNGRTGRILNILYLILSKEIDNLIFPLSRYIFLNREKYYDLLDLIDKDLNVLNDFVEYFLNGIIESTQYSFNIFKRLKTIKEEIYKDVIKSINKVEVNQFNALFNNLFFDKEYLMNVLIFQETQVLNIYHY